MPSVSQIDKLFEIWARDEFSLVNEPNESLYSFIKEKIQLYGKANKKNFLDTLTSFENMLYAIQSLSAILSDKEYGSYNNRLNPFIDIHELPKIKQLGKIISANGSTLHFLHSRLVDKLLSHFRAICTDLPKAKGSLLSQQTLFFKSLLCHYQLGFINLNYDNVILSSLSDLETGFSKSSGEFERERLYKPDWNFCYHLHGSVHFNMIGGKDTEMHKIFWNRDLSSQFAQNSSGRNQISTSEGLGHLHSNIIAGLDKSSQILREPFGSYFMQLDRLIFEADKVLFMGYGFSDNHLNSFFPFIRFDKTKKRKPLIITLANGDDGGLRYRHDKWAMGVSNTIPFNSYEMGDGTNKEPQPAIYYKKKQTFERSLNADYPLSIWYGGISEALENAKKIIDELDRN